MATLIAGFDCETTGLDPESHRIIEVGFAFYSLDGKRIGQYEQRINPQRSIDAKALAVHGITLSELLGEPVFEDIAPKIKGLLDKTSVIVAHNGIGFDFPFLATELMRSGLELPDHLKAVDTMVDGRWATQDGKLPSLRELCFSMGVEYDTSKAHAATYDTTVMMESFFKARKDYGLFQIEGIDFGVKETA